MLLLYQPRATMRRLVPLFAILFVLVHFTAPGALGSTLSQLIPHHFSGVASTQDRASDYDGVRPDVLRHLLLGRGYESYDPHKYRILDNQYLGLLIGVGALGLAAYLSILVVALRAGGRITRGPDPWRRPTALAATAGIAVLGVATGLFDLLSFPHVSYTLFFLAGMLAALSDPARQPAAAVADAARRPLPGRRSRRAARSPAGGLRLSRRPPRALRRRAGRHRRRLRRRRTSAASARAAGGRTGAGWPSCPPSRRCHERSTASRRYMPAVERGPVEQRLAHEPVPVRASHAPSAEWKKPRFGLSMIAVLDQPAAGALEQLLARSLHTRRSSGRRAQNATTSWSMNGTRTSSDDAIDTLSKYRSMLSTRASAVELRARRSADRARAPAAAGRPRRRSPPRPPGPEPGIEQPGALVALQHAAHREQPPAGSSVARA